MRFCFIASAGILAVVANAASVAETPRRVTTVVRTDARTGRLIRSVVVPPKAVVSRVVASGQAPASAVTASGGTVDEIVERAAMEHEIDPLLVHSMIKVESNYNQYAISNKGAEGLMQLIPATARRFGVRNSFDAEANIKAGVKYLRYLKDRFKDDRLALAAYNAGEGAVEKYNWMIPPYAETQNYVYQVGKRYGEARRANSQQLAVVKPVDAPKREYAPLEYFLDAEGRIHLRTK